ncbi:MAG: divalent-cation tolerance protein CutA [Desulfobacteraceae bacterium]|nr:MAG: divalent-cation tolerance protein CutA [Desulfobacteraceae bacterium]
MQIRFVYMTTANPEEAQAIGRELVTARLAACVNIIPQMSSIYLWDGKLQQDAETVLIAKTTAERVPELIARVKSLHGYTCPCIVSLAIAEGYPPFLAWVADSVAPV